MPARTAGPPSSTPDTTTPLPAGTFNCSRSSGVRSCTLKPNRSAFSSGALPVATAAGSEGCSPKTTVTVNGCFSRKTFKVAGALMGLWATSRCN
jgi:hypothetical protein